MSIEDHIRKLEQDLELAKQRLDALERQNQKLGPQPFGGPCDPWKESPFWPDNPYPHIQPVEITNPGCPVCGLGADGKPTGYVCGNVNCPYRVLVSS